MPVRLLSRLFRRRFLEELRRLHAGGALRFFGEHAALAECAAFKNWLAPLRKCEWVVYAKRPFAGPQVVVGSRGAMHNDFSAKSGATKVSITPTIEMCAVANTQISLRISVQCPASGRW